MEWLQLVVLAVIQGLTEFLPVSSSAHLILPAQLLGWQDQGLAFDVAVHLGTLLAVVWYYRSYLTKMTVGTWQGVQTRQLNDDLRLALLLVWATLPAVIFGFLFKDMIAEHSRSVSVIACTTLVFGGLLWLADARGSHRLRSEEHTSELLSRPHLVCRLLLEKKKKTISTKPPLHRPMLSPVHSLDRWVG